MAENIHSWSIRKLLGIVPVAAFLVLILLLKMENSREVIESPLLLAILNTVFRTLIPLSLAYMAGKSYLDSGVFAFLLIGCGLFIWGMSNFSAGWIMPIAGSANANVTVHNTGSLIAGIFQFAASSLFLYEVIGLSAVRLRKRNYIRLYLLLFILIALLTLAVSRNLLPVFFDPLRGPTLIRQLVLGSAVVLFFASGFMFVNIFVITGTVFAYWYGLALLLTMIGLSAVLLEDGVGSALGWAGRSAQYMGCIYLLVAFLQGRRERSGLESSAGKKAEWRLWPYLDRKVAERTKTLEDLNAALQKEIADRKRTEQKLRDSESQLKFSQRVARVGHWTWETRTNRVTWSEEMYRIFGLDPEGFSGDLQEIIEKSIHPADQGKVKAMNSAVITEGKPSPLEYRVVWPDTSVHTVWAEAGDKEVDEGGKILKLSGIVKDVTEISRIESALQANRQLLQDIIDHSPVLVYAFDTEGRFLLANRQFESLFEVSEGQLTGKPRSAIMPEDIARQRQANDREVITTGRVHEYEEEIVVNGKRRSYLTTKFPLKVEERVYAICGISLDITHHKLVESTLRRKEEYLSAIYRNSDIGIFVVTVSQDEEYRYLGINPMHERLLGVRNDLIAGKTLAELVPLFGQESVEEAGALFTRCVKVQGTVESENYIQDGPASGWWLTRITPLFDQKTGRVQRLIGSAINITERKRAEDQIRKSLEEKETLLRELYHRTKNNMAVIISLLQLQSNFSDDEALQIALKDAQNRVYSMALVHQKLYEAKDLSHINLKDYIADLVPLVIKAYATSGVAISVESSLEDIYVLIDTAIPCGLILNELLSNTLKYAFPGAKTGVIRLKLCRDTEGCIELTVEDTGSGVPQGFDFRTSGRLGLTTVFALGENQLQGQVLFENSHGVRCRVRFKDIFYSPRV